ncbi:hypothetical protein ABPG74_016917 [Tetrahymena malaccensis]
MDQQKEKSFEVKEQEMSEFNCKPDQGLLFLNNNSFLQQGGHRGDEDKTQEPDGDQLKDKQILLSEIVLNDTNQCQKYTEDDVFSVGDPRFYDLYPQNKKYMPEFTHDIFFKNCISNYTQSDVLTKNCNTPIKLNQGQKSSDYTIKANIGSRNEKYGKNQSTNVLPNNQIAFQNSIQDTAQYGFDLQLESRDAQKNQIIDHPQSKLNSTKINFDNNFSQKKQNSITFCNIPKSELSKTLSLSQVQNNLHSTCTPNNQKVRDLDYKNVQTKDIKQQTLQSDIMKLVKKFTNLLKMPSFFIHSKYFQPGYQKYINDASIFCEDLKNKEIMETLKGKLFNILKVFIKSLFTFERLIQKTDKVFLVWNSLYLLFSITLIFLYSIDSAFNFVILDNNQRNSFFLLCFCFLFGDILINLNTEVYIHDQIITEKEIIQNKYIKERLLFDLICFTSLSIKLLLLNYQIQDLYYLQIFLDFIIIFLYIHKFYKLITLVDFLNLSEWQQQLFFISKIFIYDLIIAHLVTVSLIYLSSIETQMGYSVTWISNLAHTNQDHFHSYLITYNWSIASIINSRNDLFKPETKVELIYGSIIVIFLGSVLFYSVFTVFIFIFDNQQDKQMHNKSIRILSRFLNQNQIEGQLQQRVKNYMVSIKQQQRNEDIQKESQVINSLPKQLQDEIINRINTQVFQKMGIFTQIFSQQTNNQLINKMKKVVFNPNQNIFEEGKLDDQSVYLIADGKVEIFQTYHKTERVLACLQKNSFFGEISFFSGKIRSASARSVTFSTVYKITRQEFLSVIQQKQKDNERQKLIQELILLQNNLKCIRVKCFGCQQIGHTVDKCRILNPQFDKQIIVLKQRFEHINQRKMFLRKTYKNSRVNCLQNKNYKMLTYQNFFFHRLNIKANRQHMKKFLIDLNIPQSLYSTEEEYEDEQFSEIQSKKVNESHSHNHTDGKSNENIPSTEEYSPKLQNTRSTKSLNYKKQDINQADKDCQHHQFLMKEMDQSSISIHSVTQSPNFPANNQDTQSEIIKGYTYQTNQLPRINSDFTRLTLEEDQLKRKNRNESLDKLSFKQSLLSSLKDVYKSVSNESNIPQAFIPSLNQSLNLLDKICSQLSSSYDNEEFDKKFQYYYEQIKEPSVNVIIKDIASFSNLKKIDQLNLKQKFDMKLNQIISSIPFIQNDNNTDQSSYVYNNIMSTSINNYNLIFQHFDKICHFTKFFPHNNFNQIQKQLQKIQITKLQKIKQINSNYQSQKSARNLSKPSSSYHEKNLQNLDLKNQILFQSQGITSVSYGIGYNINSKYPKMSIQKQLNS